LHGLRMLANRRKFEQRKDIDFKKLKSRLRQAMRNEEDKSLSNHRDQFAEFIDIIYKRV